MSERNKPHNGRDKAGHFKVKQADVDDLTSEPGGEDFLRDDIRLGGAVEDIGPQAGAAGGRIGDLVEENREAVRKLAEGDQSNR